MARHVCEWATRGGERRNTPAYDKGISLGVCRTILGVSVNDADSIFWCARARRLVYSAAQRARRAVSSLAQWQRPRMWIYVAAPHHTTKPRWGGDAHAGLKQTPGFGQKKSPQKNNITEKNRPRTGVYENENFQTMANCDDSNIGTVRCVRPHALLGAATGLVAHFRCAFGTG